MTPNSTPSTSEHLDGNTASSRTYSSANKRTEPYTSPYWDGYGRNNFKYQNGLGATKEELVTRQTDEYYYPDERSEYGCGWEGEYGGRGGSQAGWRRALQDPSLAAIGLVVGAIGTYLLYTAIPTAGFGGKRKRSSRREESENSIWSGLEEFEEKIDRIADGEDDGSNSWVNKIYDQFSFFNDVSNNLEEAEMEGLEPPILDETWGLGRETKGHGISANATISDAVPLEDKQTSRSKREAEEAVDEGEVEDTLEEDVEEKCRVEMWRCLSKVVEGGLHYMDKPDGLLSLAKKTMFKMAFHGGLSNVWSGVMTIPEARDIAQCMTSHTECVSYEILRREAQETMDPDDPAYIMYNRQKQDMREKMEEKEKKVQRKRERLIVNPEFVEGLDTGDGSEQYDEDYVQNRV